MRAFRILAQRPERAVVALAELCEERKGEELMSPPLHHKPPTLPPQTPYTVGNQTLRPKLEERFSPPAQFFEPGKASTTVQPVTIRLPPEHMAPKRGKWTSPPPPEAPPADHKLFENQLGMGLQLATSSTEAREKEVASETNSEIFTDEGSDVPDDDIKSVQSYTETSSPTHPGPLRRPSWHTLQETIRPPNVYNNDVLTNSSTTSSSARGRFARSPEKTEATLPASQGYEHIRRSSSSSSSSFPPRSSKHYSLPPNRSDANTATSSASSPVSTSSPSAVNTRFPFPPIDPANVYYQATPLATALRAIRHVQPSLAFPRQLSSVSGSPPDFGSQQSHPSSLAEQFQSLQTQDHVFSNSNRQRQSPSKRNNAEFVNISAPFQRDAFPSNLSASLAGLNFRSGGETRTFSFGSPDTPTPATFHKSQQEQQEGRTQISSSQASFVDKVSHQERGDHIISQWQTPNRANTDGHNSFSTTQLNSGQVDPPDPNDTPSPVVPLPETESNRFVDPSLKVVPVSSQSSGASASSGSSPTRSSSRGYSTGVSRSPSPSSPSPPVTALPRTIENSREEQTKDGGWMGGEEYGPISLRASDSVSTIKAEDNHTPQSRNSKRR